jgi:hypothetical protein
VVSEERAKGGEKDAEIRGGVGENLGPGDQVLEIDLLLSQSALCVALKVRLCVVLHLVHSHFFF